MALSNAPTSPNVNENWLFQFTADNQTCLEFHPESGSGDNNGSYIDIGNALADISPIVNFTIEFWLKSDDVTSVDFPIISKTGNTEDNDDNDSFIVKLSNNDIFIQYEYATNSNISRTTSDFSIPANTWTHVAVVRSAATDDLKVYINGALAEIEADSDTDEDPTGADSSDQRLYIGANFAKTKFYDGELAHVRVWSVARDANQIDRYYLRTVDNTATGLVGYWKLDEGTGTTAYDSSTNSNNGTLKTNHSDGTTNIPTWQIGGFDKHIHSFGLAFAHTVADSNKYYGSVLNKNITLRESLDLANGTASTGNISVTSANFTFEGVDFYKHLFNHGERNYHNKEVRVFAQFNNNSSLSSCQRIFTGRLVEVTLNQDKTVTMQINTHRPWDGITFPQDQAALTSIYVPTVYGDFTSNQSFYNTPAFCSEELFPVPVMLSNRDEIQTLMPRSYADNSYSHINIWMGEKIFLPFATSSGIYADTTTTIENQNVLRNKTSRLASGYVRGQGITDPDGSGTFFSNQHFAHDGQSTTFATAAFTNGGNNLIIGLATPPKIFATQSVRILKITHKSSVDSTFTLYAFPSPYSVNLSTTVNFTADTEITTTFDISGMGGGVVDSGLPISLVYQETGSVGGTVSINDIQFHLHLTLYSGDDDYDDREASNLDNRKYFYSGGAGLTALWDDGAIEHGHDAHRDLLQRVAGTSSADPTNWSGFNADRFQTLWKTRFWQLEPTDLKETLDTIAYEFGFNWKIDASGALKYINVVQTGEYNTLRNAGSILNLTGNDINKVNISTTGLDNVVSKMIINNKLSPAENKYFTTTTITNDTSRAKYNHGDKEGIKEVNLDYNIGTPAANSDPNNNFYAYQNNLIGDMKIIVECEVVNPAKGCQLETGDVVTFTDMPVEMFGTDFSPSTYFMIVELKRSLGTVSITAREVG